MSEISDLPDNCGVCERPFADYEPDECVMSLRELSALLGWPDPEENIR